MGLSAEEIELSLAKSISWFEQEIEWGVAAGELNHLTGRIGELYAAKITSGKMALETNQRGYDVISSENERISVKTITSSNHVTFNESTFSFVDRVMILRVFADTENGVSVETILDCSSEDILKKYTFNSRKLHITISSLLSPKKKIEKLRAIDEAIFGRYVIRKSEDSTIQILVDGQIAGPAYPVLSDIASSIKVDVLNKNGGVKNTRQLGADIIRKLKYSNMSHGVPPQEISQNISAEKHAQNKRVVTMSSSKISHQAEYKNYKIKRYDTGTIEVLMDGAVQSQALPVLRRISRFVSVDINNGAGNPKNTRTLGLDIIQKIKSINI